MLLFYRQIVLISFIVIHNLFFISYTCCIASILPALILDYVNVLHSKMGLLDFFSFLSVLHITFLSK